MLPRGAWRAGLLLGQLHAHGELWLQNEDSLTSRARICPPARSERRLNDHVFSVLQKHSGGKPTLVFCPSRKGTSDTAKRICDEAAKLKNPLVTSREQARNTYP